MADAAGDADAAALAATHAWFERHSGWAPPDPGTLADWAAEGGGRAPDECWVVDGAPCPHGLASWQVVIDALAVEDEARAQARRSSAPRCGVGTDRGAPDGDRSPER